MFAAYRWYDEEHGLWHVVDKIRLKTGGFTTFCELEYSGEIELGMVKSTEHAKDICKGCIDSLVDIGYLQSTTDYKAFTATRK